MYINLIMELKTQNLIELGSIYAKELGSVLFQ